MNIDFPFILVSLVAISGIIALVDMLFFARKRQLVGKPKVPFIADQCRSLFPVLLMVLIIRSFLLQPFRVPSGSLEPTIIPGDLIAVGMYQYGLRLPVWHNKIINIHQPKCGDIVLFRWPVNPKQDFVKRLIGLPGDHISYIDKVLYINGKQMSQTFVRNGVDLEGAQRLPVKQYRENLGGVIHEINRDPNQPAKNFYDLVVPKGEYFMMGDNRDNSDDSRDWGFVRDSAIIGKGLLVWFNWNSQTNRPRWERVGTWLNKSL